MEYSVLLVFIWHVVSVIPLIATTFPLNASRLTNIGFFNDAQQLNTKYLKQLNINRLLFQFRTIANLSTRGAKPYGGWESPNYQYGLLNGHFTGHFLSALAFTAASTGDTEIHSKSDVLVTELSLCQDAIAARDPTMSGYLSGYPLAHLERMEQHNHTKVWAPYYTLHKIMAGLLDTYVQLENKQAFSVLVKMASYFKNRIDKLISDKGKSWWQECLQVEFGGMNELGYNLYAITGNQDHKKMGDYFYKRIFMDPLANGKDSLQNMHANTHLPEVVGVARGWEVTKNKTLRKITEIFHRILEANYTFSTGGSNVNEHWGLPNKLGDAISTSFNSTTGKAINSNGFHTQETCTTYNALKVTRHLFQWTANAKLADAYERKLNNGIMGVQNPSKIGSLSYMSPLGRGVSRTKWDWWGFGTPDNAFWCCYGTTVESFSKISDSIFFRGSTPTGPKLWITQFISSTLIWEEYDIKATQSCSYMVQSASKSGPGWQEVNITISSIDLPIGLNLTIDLRIPSWAVTTRSNVKVIRPPSAGFLKDVVSHTIMMVSGPVNPGTFLTVDPPSGGWSANDTIVAVFGMVPRLERIADNRLEYENIFSIMIGPLVMAGITDGNNFISADPKDVDEWVLAPSVSLPGSMLGWIAKGANRDYDLVPLQRIVLQNYTVYFNISSN